MPDQHCLGIRDGGMGMRCARGGVLGSDDWLWKGSSLSRYQVTNGSYQREANSLSCGLSSSQVP